jgi:eukaryotic-like serine/threonine-protein kinase
MERRAPEGDDHVSRTARTEDARSFYQQRLALWCQVGFPVSSTFFVGYVLSTVVAGDDVLSALRQPSRLFHLAATLTIGGLWWALKRHPFRSEVLDLMDAAAVLVVSLLLSLMEALDDVRPVAVYTLALTTGIVAVIRAIIVPSTATRTFWLGLGASAVASAVFLLSSFHPRWPIADRGEAYWPMPSQVASFTLWLGVLVSVAVVASHVIYQLRREVRAARKIGEYVLGEKLGEGGMGIVYRATHALLRRETALKLLPPDRVDPATIRRFEREVVETGRLRHPNTVAIYDYGRTLDGIFYYAMEYLDGLDIGQLIEREGPLPPGRVVFLLAQVCASLDEAHSMGLVHRDIKPANVMVVGNTAAYDLVKVLDFGLVKSAAPLDGGASLTVRDQLTGTPRYMAPETIAHPDAAEPRSDLYAAAALGYFMLSGEHVFEGASLVEVLAAHLHAPPVPVSERLGREVPTDLEALIMRGLAKAPSDRPPSAAAFRELLERCEVTPWTQRDARVWWRTHGERALRLERPGDLASHPTVTVVRGSYAESR